MALTNDDFNNEDSGILVDTIYPGRPLVITCAGINGHHSPVPYFVFRNTLRKLEAKTNSPINKIFLRDHETVWYHRGVRHFSRDIRDTSLQLLAMKEQITPSSTTVIGDSMGATAALIFGVDIGADHVLAMVPRTVLALDWTHAHNDRRNIARLETLHALPPTIPKIFDVAAYCTQHIKHTQIEIHYGTRSPDPQATHLDALHAMRMGHLPGCKLRPHPDAQHLITRYLEERDALVDLVAGTMPLLA